MEEKEAFAALVRISPKWLDRPIEDLVKMRAVGDVYLAAHKRMMREIKAGKLNLAEEDLKTRQAEADIVGSAVLDSKVKIGEMSQTEPQTEPKKQKGASTQATSLPSDQPLKHERLGLGKTEMHRFQTLARNPKAIEQVKAEAREFGDPPTETAVLNKIRAKRAEDYIKTHKEELKKTRVEMNSEEQVYILLLEKIISILPKSPPQNWTESFFKQAQAYSKIIIKRLEAFNGQETKGITE